MPDDSRYRLAARPLALAGALLMTGFSSHAAAQVRVYVAIQNDHALGVIDTATDTLVATVPIGQFPQVPDILPDGSRVYVTNAGDDSVSVVDTTTLAVVDTIGVGANPVGLAVHPDGTRVYVTNATAGTVSVIDTSTHAIVATVATGLTAIHAAAHPDGSRVYIANRGDDTVSVLETTSNTIIETIGVQNEPNRIAVHPSGLAVLVPHNGDPMYSVIYAAGDDVIAAPDGFFGGFGVLVDQPALAYVSQAGATLGILDLASNALVGSIAVPAPSFDFAMHPDGTRAYVDAVDAGEVYVIDTTTHTVLHTIPVGAIPISMTISPWSPCPGDTNGDGVIDVQDLLTVLGAWGTCR